MLLLAKSLLAMVSIFNIRRGLKLLPFIILGFVTYSNTIQVPFYVDDLPNIAENPNIRLTKLTFKDLISEGFKTPSFSRPLAKISFALNYYFHQDNVIGYHVINMIIHILTGILLFFFSKTTVCISIRQCSHSSIPESLNPSIMALFAALVWLVHPIHTQSVTYVVQRMNSMSAMFYVLSFL
ncbi:MAG: hypothetical protein ACYTEL_01000, partial [Planctomycetota bacterium]